MRQTRPTKNFDSGKHSFLYDEWMKTNNKNNFFATHKPYDIGHHVNHKADNGKKPVKKEDE